MAAIADHPQRPLWSVMIPTYNSGAFLRETLKCLLAQALDPREMEIEVIDNCSTSDDPEALVREIAGDRVRFFRQPENVGAVENFNTCIRRARGHWVYILHSDDIIRPGFVDRATTAMRRYPEVDAIIFRLIYIDEHGMWMGLSDLEARTQGILDDGFAARQLRDQRIQFVGMLVRRSAYEELGGFRKELVHCADWDMWNRLVINKRAFYEPEPLACYRLHAGAESSRMVRLGENVADERRAIRLACGYVSPDYARLLYRDAMRAAAVRASRRMRRLWRSGDSAIAWRQCREALRCSLAPVVLARLFCMAGLMIVERLHQPARAKIGAGAPADAASQRPADDGPVAIFKAACFAVMASASPAEENERSSSSQANTVAGIERASKEPR